MSLAADVAGIEERVRCAEDDVGEYRVGGGQRRERGGDERRENRDFVRCRPRRRRRRRRGLAEGPYRDVRLHRVHEIGAVQQIRKGKQIRAAAEIRVPKSRLADARNVAQRVGDGPRLT